jgi:hypothetical protein
MVRTAVCGFHLLLAMTFAMPGCPKKDNVPRPCAPVEEPTGLPPGTVAPEIDGEDIDGAPLKLSDYRGKVVLLSFWGHW